MDEFEMTVLSDLAALKSQMGALIGLGQPGRLTLLEQRMERHEIYLQRMKGVAGAIFLLLTAAQIIVDTLRR
ncbi:MAG TPA: hypothetical protein VN670_03925 [Acidobacteriaceae bacterium]|nr:hypothetical protein [Acidobacteriaceae bacterium]